MSRHIKPAYKRAARMLGFALTLGNYETWSATAAVWAVRLTAEERAALAWAGLKSLTHEQAAMVAETALGGAGMPQAAFLSDMDQAAFWADFATPSELDAYGLACFRNMRAGRQSDFLEFVGKPA
ncbi:MAG: hypothetical protein ACU0C9_14130 [Paracoccaceae bacterium]